MGRGGRTGHAAETVLAPSTRSANGMLMNMMMMSDENHRDIYISTVAVPPPGRCAACREASRAHPGEGLGGLGTWAAWLPTPWWWLSLWACVAVGDPSAQCLRHGFMLHTKYQVVYPFPTFQPAFQLKKDQVVLLNTSYSLVACAVSVHSAGRSPALMTVTAFAVNRVRLILSLPHVTEEETEAQRGASSKVTQPGSRTAGIQTRPRPLPALSSRTFLGAGMFHICVHYSCQQ